MSTKYGRFTCYLERKKTERAARRWARGVEKTTGARLSQPVSAFLRYLVDQHERRGR